MATLALLTDFGQRDGYVGIMKGVIREIAPEAKVIDLSHEVPPQDVQAGRFVLWNSYKYFPKGTIFCCVVDPGVGSKRAILAVQTEDYLFIAPDNGLLDYVLAEVRVKQMLEVENPRLMRSQVSRTFHGRDIFAPAAAQLAAGFLYTQVGPLASYRVPPSPFVLPDPPATQAVEIIYFDHFGNAITNLRLPEPLPAVQSVRLGGQAIEGLVPSYAQAGAGQLLAIGGSHGLLEIAINQGNAQRELGLSYGDSVEVSWKT
jgi:S-adenosylmethionine hydrolase